MIADPHRLYMVMLVNHDDQETRAVTILAGQNGSGATARRIACQLMPAPWSPVLTLFKGVTRNHPDHWTQPDAPDRKEFP